jgi:phosphate starvation-inducible PhoH-like protein
MNKTVSPKNHEEPQQTKNGKHHRFRKMKKVNEKELLGIYFADSQDLQESSSYSIQEQCQQKQQYLSQRERTNIEQKFTKPKNMHQEQYVNLLKQKQKKIIVVAGPAGTGKTLFATEYGIRNFMLGVYERLVFTRPSVSVDEDIGYLPGSLEDKMAPWIRPIYDILYQHMSPYEVQKCIEEKTIEIAPLGFMRGRTFKNTWIVADEMQNSTISQMKMLLTRLGENSRVVVTGDLDQHDRAGEVNGLEDFLNKFRGKRSSSISSFEFEKNDVQREEVVKEVLDIYSSEIVPTYYTDKNNQEDEKQDTKENM